MNSATTLLENIKRAFWRCFLPVVLIASIDFPLYLSNRLRVEYLLFPSFPLVICPKRSDIAMKCHLVRKFLCAAPDLPLNRREPGKPHQTDCSATDKQNTEHTHNSKNRTRSVSTHTKLQGFNSLLFSHKKLLGFKIYKLNEKNGRNTLLVASFFLPLQC